MKDAYKHPSDLVYIPNNYSGDWNGQYKATSYVNDINNEYTQVLAEETESCYNPKTYTYGNGMNSAENAWEKDYYMYDGRGYVSNLTSQYEYNMVSYKYDEFGNQWESGWSNFSSYGYNGESYDYITGLQYLRARYYDPATGRFLTQDTVQGDVMNPLTQNLYSYTQNNPLNLIDPSGHISKELIQRLRNRADEISSRLQPVLRTIQRIISPITSMFSSLKNIYTNLQNAQKLNDELWRSCDAKLPKVLDPTLRKELIAQQVNNEKIALFNEKKAFEKANEDLYALYTSGGSLPQDLVSGSQGTKLKPVQITELKHGGQVLESEDPDSIALHESLAIWSFVPYANFVAIPANALLYAYEGDYLNAISLSNGYAKIITFNKPTSKIDEAANEQYNSSKTPMRGEDWNMYFKETYGKDNVSWDTVSINKIIDTPSIITNLTPQEVANSALKSGWTVESLGKGRLAGVSYDRGGGFSMRAPNGGSEYIQYHPGGGHHGDLPYFKVSSGPNGTVRYDINGGKLN